MRIDTFTCILLNHMIGLICFHSNVLSHRENCKTNKVEIGNKLFVFTQYSSVIRIRSCIPPFADVLTLIFFFLLFSSVVIDSLCLYTKSFEATLTIVNKTSLIISYDYINLEYQFTIVGVYYVHIRLSIPIVTFETLLFSIAIYLYLHLATLLYKIYYNDNNHG